MRIPVLAGALAFILLTAALAGCGNQSAPKEISPILSVRQRESGSIVTMGDTRNQVTKITGKSEAHVLEFTKENIERVSYWDAPGIFVDYLEDKVVAIRLTDTDDWELTNGARVGMTKADVEKLYADIAEREEGQSGGLLISYDENLNPVPFDESSYYLFRITYVDGLVDVICIQYGF